MSRGTGPSAFFFVGAARPPFPLLSTPRLPPVPIPPSPGRQYPRPPTPAGPRSAVPAWRAGPGTRPRRPRPPSCRPSCFSTGRPTGRTPPAAAQPPIRGPGWPGRHAGGAGPGDAACPRRGGRRGRGHQQGAARWHWPLRGRPARHATRPPGHTPWSVRKGGCHACCREAPGRAGWWWPARRGWAGARRGRTSAAPSTTAPAARICRRRRRRRRRRVRDAWPAARGEGVERACLPPGLRRRGCTAHAHGAAARARSQRKKNKGKSVRTGPPSPPPFHPRLTSTRAPPHTHTQPTPLSVPPPLPHIHPPSVRPAKARKSAPPINPTVRSDRWRATRTPPQTAIAVATACPPTAPAATPAGF